MLVTASIATSSPSLFHDGLAGWPLPAERRARSKGQSGPARYPEVFEAVEINSTHLKFHLPKTFARWCAEVPADFRSAVKMLRGISNVQCLTRMDEALNFPHTLEAF